MYFDLLKKLNNIIIVLLFCGVVFIPLILGLLEDDKDVSIVEKRRLAPFPEVRMKADSIGKFPDLFAKYYTDHFGLRDSLVMFYKIIKFSLGDSPSQDVTIGKDGWLFLGSIKKGYNRYDNPMGDVRNVDLFSEEALDKFAFRMKTLNKWLEKKGIKYIFIIAPNKHTVYFENLPKYINKSGNFSSTDQLVAYLQEHTDITIIDLRDDLIKSKKKHQLYYRTDTHWNHYAANLAQYKIISKIETFFPGLVEPELFPMTKGDMWKGGDLIQFVGVKNVGELAPQPVFKNTCTPERHPSIIKFGERHEYKCEGSQLSVLIYRDSFFTALAPYFSRKFNHSTYIWEKLSYRSLHKEIDIKKPDIVIEEWGERVLPFVPGLDKRFLE